MMPQARDVLVFLLALGAAGLPAALWAQTHVPGPIDRGIGVAYLRSEFGRDNRAARESLLVRSRPDSRSEVIAVFLRREQGPGRTWSYALSSRESLVPALLEFDYEILGLPIDSIAPDSAWTRAVLGYDGVGRQRVGWIELDAVHAEVALWREHLPAREWLFFTDSVPPPVFDGPGGRPLRAEGVFIGDGSYSLYVEETRGDWMHVRIVSPDDGCGRDVTGPRVTHAWVRYLDAGGRPRVWYHTRGC